MSGKKTSKHASGGHADDPRLRYHLTSLYALKPVPDDLMSLVHEIDARLEGAQSANDGD